MKRSILWKGLAAALVFYFTSGYRVTAQGSLTPAGAPAPTMKTLDQVEPRIDVQTLAGDASSEFIISEPGSYYLSGNLNVAKTYGIYINATNVTLDLSGFSISRTAAIGGAGIYIAGGMDKATVFNGSIDGGPIGFNYGIRCLSSPAYADSCMFEKLTVTRCSSTALIAGTSALLIDCRVNNNTGNGIDAREGSRLTGCIAHDNQGYGIFAFTGSSLEGCVAYNNQGNYGIGAYSGSSLVNCTAYGNESTYAIYAHSGATITDCAAYDNTGTYGIYAGDGSTLSSCAAYANIGSGIHGGTGSSLYDCTAKQNNGEYGIRAGGGSTIARSSADGNIGNGGSSYGIYAGAASIISDCVSFQNSNTNAPGLPTQGCGIYAEFASTVRNCNVIYNEGDGIRVNYSTLVTDNNSNFNGYIGDGAGIHAVSNRNRIENNNVQNNDRGIEVSGGGCLIIKNTSANNPTSYEIATNNVVGTIVIAPTSGPISGFTGGAGVGTTDPWANFSF